MTRPATVSSRPAMNRGMGRNEPRNGAQPLPVKSLRRRLKEPGRSAPAAKGPGPPPLRKQRKQTFRFVAFIHHQTLTTGNGCRSVKGTQ